nr:MchS3 family protein [uncultured Erwinia sp.]
MKGIKVYLISTICVTALSAQATGIDTGKELASVALFSLGLNGFVAKKMPEQLIYEEVLNNGDAVLIFKEIIQSPDSTPEGKAYAACGLWAKNQLDNIHPDEALEKKSVTVLTGDVLRKESFGHVIKGIKTRGCY